MQKSVYINEPPKPVLVQKGKFSEAYTNQIKNVSQEEEDNRIYNTDPVYMGINTLQHQAQQATEKGILLKIF